MVKNTHGGTGHKKTKNKPTMAVRKIEEIAKNPNPAEFESYGVIVNPMGNRRFMVKCQEIGNPGLLRELNCSLRGAHRKKVCSGDHVLVKIFDFNTSQGIIIDAYREEEVDSIRRAGLWDFPDDEIAKDVKPKPVKAAGKAAKVPEPQERVLDMGAEDSDASGEESSDSEIETIAQAVKKKLPADFDIDTI